MIDLEQFTQGFEKKIKEKKEFCQAKQVEYQKCNEEEIESIIGRNGIQDLYQDLHFESESFFFVKWNHAEEQSAIAKHTPELFNLNKKPDLELCQ